MQNQISSSFGSCAICGERIERIPKDALILHGDSFYSLTCEECSSSGQARFERQLLSWRNATHLVLYHLHTTDPHKRYFRWKEDICAFIDAHWEGLLPAKAKGVNWQNSVSSVLSSNQDVFRNGFEEMNEQGWWCLIRIEPPYMYAQAPKIKPIKLEPIFSSSAAKNNNSTLNLDTVTNSEEIKRELLKKLLQVDKSILTQALNTAPPPPAPVVVPPVSASSSPATKRNPITANRYLPISEADVLRRSLQLPTPHPLVKRLIRKIINRRAKRKLGLPIFDLDQFIYEYLKNESPLYLGEETNRISNSKTTTSTACNTPVVKYLGGRVPLEQSFRAKVLGVTSLYEEWPTPFVSPFTGYTLPGVLMTLPDVRPPQLQLLQELKTLAGKPDDDVIRICYLRKELLGQANHLLQHQFFPRIDIAEYLEAPDYCLCAMYKFRIVSLAIMSPEGYLDYLWTAPGWRSSNLARSLLYLLIRRCPARDITLHVLPDNYQAMRLYQEFGFKIDRFILGFYEQYYPPEKPGTRNAFFMRLRK